MNDVYGVAPNAFTIKDARAYFKYRERTGNVDEDYENSIRYNFKTEEAYQAFIQRLLNS